MSITAVPISMRLVFAPTAARSGKGEASWRGKRWTRKKRPPAPNSSAAWAGSMDCRSVSAAERVCDCDEGVQCPNERKPIFFMEGNLLLSGLVCDRRCAVLSPGREHVANYSPLMRSRFCWAMVHAVWIFRVIVVQEVLNPATRDNLYHVFFGGSFSDHPPRKLPDPNSLS